MDRSVKVKRDQEKARIVKVGREVCHGCSLSSIVFNWYSEYLTKEALECFGGFRIGQLIRTLKYADCLVLRTKEKVVLQGMAESLIEIGSCCGMGINLEETEVIKMPRQPSHAQIMVHQVQPKSVEYCSYLGGMINNIICTREFTYRIAVAKAAVNNKKNVSPEIWN
jgi:hypothetical protein